MWARSWKVVKEEQHGRRPARTMVASTSQANAHRCHCQPSKTLQWNLFAVVASTGCFALLPSGAKTCVDVPEQILRPEQGNYATFVAAVESMHQSTTDHTDRRKSGIDPRAAGRAHLAAGAAMNVLQWNKHWSCISCLSAASRFQRTFLQLECRELPMLTSTYRCAAQQVEQP